jgi:hypothetical protein
VPVLSARPDDLMRHLWRRGFDATRGASSLSVVAPPPDRPDLMPEEVTRMMERVVYLPIHGGASDADVQRLARATGEFEGAAQGVSLARGRV